MPLVIGKELKKSLQNFHFQFHRTVPLKTFFSSSNSPTAHFYVHQMLEFSYHPTWNLLKDTLPTKLQRYSQNYSDADHQWNLVKMS